jgi:thiol:disulfide interchange protein DsbD
MQPWCLNVIRHNRGKIRQSALLWLALLAAGFVSAQPSGLFNSSRPAFLDVDEAFQFYTSLDSADEIAIHWTVAPEYYLYRDKFSFSLVADDGETLELAASMPEGNHHHDEFFGDVEVYYHGLTTALTLPTDAPAGDFQLQIRYQGCAEAGLCYPPQTRLLEISP